MRDSETLTDPSERFGYFVVHTHATRENDLVVVHIRLEDLRTGEKLALRSSGELSRYLDEWAGVRPDDERFAPHMPFSETSPPHTPS